MARPLLVLLPALLALSACGKPAVEAPADKGVCWTMNAGKAGAPVFHEVSRNVPDMEHCAANLEALRLKFLGLGGNKTELDGAYQGTFIYVQREGIFTAPDLNKSPYLALVRTNDGRLVVPGAAANGP